MKTLIVTICVLALCACNQNNNNSTDNKNGESHHHSHDPQYGGVLVEVGDHFAHAEMVNNDGKLTLYFLDGEAENNVRLEQGEIAVTVKVKEESFDLALKGVPSKLTGETEKNTSQFSATSEKLKGVSEFTATVKSCTIKGKKLENITFTFPHKGEEKEDDHGHNHDEDDHGHDH